MAGMTFACAHRGDNHCAPENTLPAFGLALRKRARQIEFDLRVTRDEQLIVMHDETVDRTTDGTGKTTDLTLAEVRALDAGSGKSAEFAGTRVPTFEEVLQLVSGFEGLPEYAPLLNVQLYLEPHYVPLVIDSIKSFGMEPQCFLACDRPHIAAARALDPSIRICSLDGQRGPDSDYPDRTIALGAEFIQLCGPQDRRGWADCMAEVVAKLHRHGVTVNYFGTEDPEMMRRLQAAGVDYVLTDHLDLAQQVLEQGGA